MSERGFRLEASTFRIADRKPIRVRAGHGPALTIGLTIACELQVSTVLTK